jgi:hypothetical protein
MTNSDDDSDQVAGSITGAFIGEQVYKYSSALLASLPSLDSIQSPLLHHQSLLTDARQDGRQQPQLHVASRPDAPEPGHKRRQGAHQEGPQG